MPNLGCARPTLDCARPNLGWRQTNPGAYLRENFWIFISVHFVSSNKKDDEWTMEWTWMDMDGHGWTWMDMDGHEWTSSIKKYFPK